MFAKLTADMGNLITGQNISFYVNDVLVGTVNVNESKENITYIPTAAGLLPVNGDYSGHTNYTINIQNGLLNITRTNFNSKAIMDASSSGSGIMRISGDNVRLENLIFRNMDTKIFSGAVTSNSVNLTIVN
ncbi:hypothetical protein ALNOE001_02920 [Candidatus Methanobinarius endosymbioticus]|uniref:Uncharacterized protein n=1 Tax=Candidatus Methanobinarius endosymbioticus TaxID=2006182 RepID=A0A366MFK1_9EURY|nr:hypothetical protein ALNOE001_02920 [Candidatus Methanobinarius endosymbioticus]